MKKLLLGSLMVVSLNTISASNGETKSAAGQIPAKENKTGVWAEEKGGTYRESTLGSLLFGRCKRSQNLCMIIIHDGDRNAAKPGGSVNVDPDGASKIYKFSSYKESTFIDEDGKEGEEVVFTLIN